MAIPATEQRRTMTVEEAGAILGVSRATAYKLAREKEFPAIRAGKRIIVPTAAFFRWMEAAAVKAVAE